MCDGVTLIWVGRDYSVKGLSELESIFEPKLQKEAPPW
jgi:hypothetical protein